MAFGARTFSSCPRMADADGGARDRRPPGASLASDGWEPAAACAVCVATLLMVGLAGGKNDAEGFPGTR